MVWLWTRHTTQRTSAWWHWMRDKHLLYSFVCVINSLSPGMSHVGRRQTAAHPIGVLGECLVTTDGRADVVCLYWRISGIVYDDIALLLLLLLLLTWKMRVASMSSVQAHCTVQCWSHHLRTSRLTLMTRTCDALTYTAKTVHWFHRVVKSNHHMWFSHDLSQIMIWICPSLPTTLPSEFSNKEAF